MFIGCLDFFFVKRKSVAHFSSLIVDLEELLPHGWIAVLSHDAT